MSKLSDVTGTVPASKNQKNKGKSAAKLARKAPIVHGGSCSKCGQTSNSATVGTAHSNCPGYSGIELPSPIVQVAVEKAGGKCDGKLICADGSVFNGKGGLWITNSHLTLKQQTNNEDRVERLGEAAGAALAWDAEQRAKRCFSSKTKLWTNGLGEPIAAPGVAETVDTLTVAEERVLTLASDDATFEETLRREDPIAAATLDDVFAQALAEQQAEALNAAH